MSAPRLAALFASAENCPGGWKPAGLPADCWSVLKPTRLPALRLPGLTKA